MSVADFDLTLQNRIFNRIKDIKRDDRKKYLESLDTTKLRKKYESAASGASSVFTESGLDKLRAALISDVQDLGFKSSAITILNSIDYKGFAKFALANFSSKGGSISDREGVLRLSSVPQGTLINLFLDYVETVIATSNVTNASQVYDYISKHINAGHLAGVFSLKLKEVLNLDIESTGTGYRDFTITNEINQVTKNSLDMVLKALLDADYVTSNIYDKEEIFANATKSVLGPNPHLEIEIQFSKDNKQAGDLLQQAGRNLNNILDKISGNASKQLGQFSDVKGAEEAFTSLIQSLRPLADMLLVRAKELQVIDIKNKKLYEDIVNNAANLNKLSTYLIDTKGSPSLKESIGLNIANLIGTGKPLKQIVTKLTKKNKTISKDPVSLDMSKTLTKIAKSIGSAKAKVGKTPTVRNPKQVNGPTNLTSLQNLINQHLQSVISANMGDGSETRILNYQTGRFAASAKVERLSQSRAGMITAFYTYMKNPYQTFEPGFRQGSPKSRDPKLLISKSIREIAETKVGNRLRAVLV